MRTILTSFLTAFSLCCSAQVSQYSWLAGTWKLQEKEVYEVWKFADDQTFLEGYSFRVKNGDTIRMEIMKLTFEQGKFHYLPDVPGNQGAVDFVATSSDQNGFVVENPNHDFPKLIRYKIIRRAGIADVIEAAIEGNGKVIPYTFSRVR